MKRRMFAMLLVGMLIFVSGCTQEEKKNTYWFEGGDNAYMEDKNGKIITLKNPTSVTYSVYGLEGDYLTAAKHACTQISGVSSGIYITTKTTASKYDKFTFCTIASDMGFNAVNDYETDTNGKLYESIIYFNTKYMDNYSLSAKKMLAMHEMGHTVGLRDFYDGSKVCDEDATVMKWKYEPGYTIFTTYTEFDKKCIQHKYGE